MTLSNNIKRNNLPLLTKQEIWLVLILLVVMTYLYVPNAVVLGNTGGVLILMSLVYARLKGRYHFLVFSTVVLAGTWEKLSVWTNSAAVLKVFGITIYFFDLVIIFFLIDFITFIAIKLSSRRIDIPIFFIMTLFFVILSIVRGYYQYNYLAFAEARVHLFMFVVFTVYLAKLDSVQMKKIISYFITSVFFYGWFKLFEGIYSGLGIGMVGEKIGADVGIFSACSFGILLNAKDEIIIISKRFTNIVFICSIIFVIISLSSSATVAIVSAVIVTIFLNKYKTIRTIKIIYGSAIIVLFFYFSFSLISDELVHNVYYEARSFVDPVGGGERLSKPGFSGTAEWRLEQYEYYFENYIKENPLLGLGYGNSSLYFVNKIGQRQYGPIHSGIVFFQTKVGILGLIFFLLLNAYIYYWYFKIKKMQGAQSRFLQACLVGSAAIFGGALTYDYYPFYFTLIALSIEIIRDPYLNRSTYKATWHISPREI